MRPRVRRVNRRWRLQLLNTMTSLTIDQYTVYKKKPVESLKSCKHLSGNECQASRVCQNGQRNFPCFNKIWDYLKEIYAPFSVIIHSMLCLLKIQWNKTKGETIVICRCRTPSTVQCRTPNTWQVHLLKILCLSRPSNDPGSTGPELGTLPTV